MGQTQRSTTSRVSCTCSITIAEADQRFRLWLHCIHDQRLHCIHVVDMLSIKCYNSRYVEYYIVLLYVDVLL